jgi:hypothetical protein
LQAALIKENDNLRKTIESSRVNCRRPDEVNALKAAQAQLYKEHEEECRNNFDLQQENHDLTMRIGRLVAKCLRISSRSGALEKLIQLVEKTHNKPTKVREALEEYAVWKANHGYNEDKPQ